MSNRRTRPADSNDTHAHLERSPAHERSFSGPDALSALTPCAQNCPCQTTKQERKCARMQAGHNEGGLGTTSVGWEKRM